MEGVFNTIPLRPVTAPGRLSDAPDDASFPDRYVLAQKLEYIRTCRVKHRGSRSRLRLITEPNTAGGADFFPRESRRGVPLRKGINRSWDGMRPTSPSVSSDFKIYPGAEQDVRTDFGYRNQTSRPVSPVMMTSAAESPTASVVDHKSDLASASERPWFNESLKATKRTGLASTAACRKADHSVFQEQSSSPMAFKRVQYQGDCWNSSTLLDNGSYWANRMATAKGARVGDSPNSAFAFSGSRSRYLDKSSLATTSRLSLSGTLGDNS